jgi:hypothetical protein
MQRIAALLAVLTPGAAAAQTSAAAELWRVAATTLVTPEALATGGASALWSPAQLPPAGRATLSLEIVQTPSALAATGAFAVARLRVHPVGALGLVYGSMRIADLVHTSVDPTPDGQEIPYGTRLLGVNWTLTAGGTTLGATVGWEHIRLDETHSDRATCDVGIRQDLPGPLWLSIASHLFSPITSDQPLADFYGGIEWAVWRGSSWQGSGPVTVLLRYGAALGTGLAADHELGFGVALARTFAFDVKVVREGNYGEVGWRGTAGVRFGIGRYRVTYARDTGSNDIGSAYRVGLESDVR